jgi:tetratricopeptide (TPR) repeat protein
VTSCSRPGPCGTPRPGRPSASTIRAAEALLDDALRLHADPQGWLERAWVRIRLSRYGEALDDVERAADAGPAALEVGAWACYFDRRFAQAAQFAGHAHALAGRAAPALEAFTR